METETWVVGYEGKYLVSIFGFVTRVSKSGLRASRSLKPWKAKRGRFIIGLRDSPRKRRCAYVHRLVMETFIGPCPEGKETNHIDGNPVNNALTNLEYVTPQENILHAYRIGLMLPKSGVMNGSARLTDNDIADIRKSPEGPTVLAKRYGVVKSSISGIQLGKSWTHLPGKRSSMSNRNKTHCVRGHLFDVQNTWVEKDGRRHCRACNRLRKT